MHFMSHRIIARFSLMLCLGCPITLTLKMYFREEGREDEKREG